MQKDIRQAIGKGTGTYALVMKLDRSANIPVGRFGPVSFAAGYYVYTGSAFGPGGLAARIGRHLQQSKKCRWHVDYLRRFAEVTEIWYTFSPEKMECRWATVFKKTRGARIACYGFGSSDCRCGAHLFHLKRHPGIKTFRRKVANRVSIVVSHN